MIFILRQTSPSLLGGEGKGYSPKENHFAQIIMFSIKRSGEVQRKTIKQYTDGLTNE